MVLFETISDYVPTAGVVAVLSGLVLLGVLRASPATTISRSYERKQPTEPQSRSSKIQKKICPFSQESNFLVETAEHLPPSPLDLYEGWMDPSSNEYGKPLAARWLQAGLSGQDTPGLLRAGLKRLRNAKHFLVQEPFRLEEELRMKAKALDDPQRFPKVFVAENDSLDAQRECLELFLSYLPKRYPDLYTYDKAAHTIRVNAIDTTYRIDEWQKRPLELCERIVQEDLVLMRPPRPATDAFDSFAMAAAAVVFSFDGLPEKLGQPVEFIHAPVPGFEKHLRKTLNLTFQKILKVEQPMWRNNWGISPSGELDNPLYGSTEAHSHRSFSKPTVDEIKSKYLKVEYQTIRRLPRTGYLLFTVKTMADRMDALEDVPEAAACLARSIRGMSPAMQAYKGIEDEATAEVVLEYLDSIGGSISK